MWLLIYGDLHLRRKVIARSDRVYAVDGYTRSLKLFLNGLNSICGNA